MTQDRRVRILVVGKNGQVGRELVRAALPAGIAIEGLAREELDITRLDMTTRSLEASRCDLVVNVAAYTQVDRAESEPEAAFAVNRDGPANLAAACRRLRVPLLHISTDYVFDGSKAGSYAEADPVRPLGIYGQSKEAGERAIRDRLDQHIILRTAWVFSPFRSNFVKTMLRLGRERDEIGIVDDQTGCPTAAADIAAATIGIAAQVTGGGAQAWGTYHFCGAGPTTWFGFATAIFEQAVRYGHPVPRLKPIASADYPTPAQRPANSVLDCTRIGESFGIAPRSWGHGLEECIAQLLGHEGNTEGANSR